MAGVRLLSVPGVAVTLWLVLSWTLTAARRCESSQAVPRAVKEVHHEQHGGFAFLYHPCVDLRLKKELSLLAEACVYNQAIIPHPNLTRERPLALAAWGRRLEMSAIDLSEAVLWLRKSVSRARGSEGTDGKAKPASKLAHRATVCPGHRVKVLQSYFVNADFGPSTRKWRETKGSSLPAMLQSDRVLLRRRREVPDRQRKPVRLTRRETRSPTKARAQRGVEEQNKMAKSTTGAFNTVKPSSVVVKPQPLTSARLLVTGDGSAHQTPRQQEHNGHSQESEGETQQSIDSRGTTGTLDSKASKLVTKNARPSTKARGTTADTGRNAGVATGRSQPEKAAAPRGAEREPPGHSRRLGNSSGPAQARGGPHEAGEARQQDSQGKSLHFTPERSEPRASPGTQSGEGGRPPNLGAGQTQPRQSAGGGASSRDRDEPGPTAPGQGTANETLPRQSGSGLPTGGGVTEAANVKCKCEGGESQNSKAAAEKTDSRLGDRAPYIPTPRTEEAAWAAAALTFLFVFLTLAVLYTRLYRKFIKSDSLYWAPGINREENVTDVLKRRLVLFSKRRKKKWSYKKKPVLPYDHLQSDESD